jgi:hypothetical protein
MTPACTQNLRLKALLGLVNFNLKTGDCRSLNLKFNQKALTVRQGCGSGSGIRRLFDPWILDPGWVKNQNPYPGSGSVMNNPDHIL